MSDLEEFGRHVGEVGKINPLRFATLRCAMHGKKTVEVRPHSMIEICCPMVGVFDFASAALLDASDVTYLVPAIFVNKPSSFGVLSGFTE